MSLHGKIVSWFVFFAALTVLLLGLGDYFQTTRSLRSVLEGRVSTAALQGAADTERRYGILRSELVALASAASMGSVDTFSLAAAGTFSRVVVTRGGEPLLDHRTTDEPDGARPCVTAPVDFDFQFPDPAGRTVTVRAEMPAARFFAPIASVNRLLGERGITAVVRPGDGAVLQDVGCRLGSADASFAVPLTVELSHVGAEPDATPHVHAFEGDAGQPLIAAMVAAPRPGWAVLASVDESEFAAPFLTARVRYVAFMALVILVALGLVLRGIRSDLRRLSGIARAADEIGRGRFDVWLPPPTADEVGRVSLALGRMVDRLSASIRQIEITRSMAAVGELSAYLSHEIRNPLSSIKLNLQMLRRDLAAGQVPEDGQQLVDLCITELRRLDGVVKAVLQMARDGQGDAAGTCYVNRTISETAQMMRGKLDEHGVALELNLDPEETAVTMDGAALRGIFMNLVLNGIDAMGDAAERRLTVRTDRFSDPSGGTWLALAVRDTGPGVPPHLRERIFDPFFTTKATGNGIGLSTALRSAQACGGLLRYAPAAEGTGAEFILELPLAKDGSMSATPVESMTQSARARWREEALATTGVQSE